MNFKDHNLQKNQS